MLLQFETVPTWPACRLITFLCFISTPLTILLHLGPSWAAATWRRCVSGAEGRQSGGSAKENSAHSSRSVASSAAVDPSTPAVIACSWQARHPRLYHTAAAFAIAVAQSWVLVLMVIAPRLVDASVSECSPAAPASAGWQLGQSARLAWEGRVAGWVLMSGHASVYTLATVCRCVAVAPTSNPRPTPPSPPRPAAQLVSMFTVVGVAAVGKLWLGLPVPRPLYVAAPIMLGGACMVVVPNILDGTGPGSLTTGSAWLGFAASVGVWLGLVVFISLVQVRTRPLGGGGGWGWVPEGGVENTGGG